MSKSLCLLVKHIGHTVVEMTLRLTNIRLESELSEGLQRVKDRDGISISEQIRRAVKTWLNSKGVTAKKIRRARSARPK